MAKNYLVTGGSGFIGAALVERLVGTGHKVRVLDNNSRGNARRLARVAEQIEFIEGDIRDPSTTIAAAEGIDCVCHLAYVNGTEFFYSRPELVLDVAVRGMLNVIDACRQHGIGDLVLASSSEVYQSPPVMPTPEEVPLVVPDITNPRFSYGGGKILCELMAINYGRTCFDRVTIFRPHNVYGPDMGWEHVIPQFALRAQALTVTAGKSGAVQFPIKGDGLQTRSFVHIEDFTDGLMQVIEKGDHLGIYHIGTTDEVSVAELARQVVACFGANAEIVPSEAPAGETNRRCPDITKLRGLGYNPKISLAEGLKRTVLWYVENVDLNPHNN
jgi:nucleoside-diphosphate-sugar epimerase